MRPAKIILVLVLLLYGATTSEMVFSRGSGGRSGGSHAGGRHAGGGHGHHHSRGSHGHRGVFVGGLGIAPWYYFPAAIYWPVDTPYLPTGYIEQGTDLYYCASAQSYYPDVEECPGGWQAITPEPTPPPP